MHYSNEQLIILFAFLPVLMAAITAAFKLKQVKGPLKVLCLSIFFALFVEIITRILWLLNKPNLFILPIYVVIELGLLLWMYSLVLNSSFLIRNKVWLILAFTVLVACDSYFKFEVVHSVGRIIESAIVIMLVVAYFYKTFQELKVQDLWQEPFFWISSGLLLFFSVNILIYIFVNFLLLYSKELNHQIWVVHSFLNALLYCSYSLALWISPKN